MDYFSAVLNQVIIFLMIIVVGFIVVKIKAVPTSILPSISIIFAKIVVPAILFFNTVNGSTREDMVETIFLLGIVLVLFAVIIIVMRIMPKVLKLEGNRGKLFPVLFSFGNVGFVGIPLLITMFGQRAMVFVTMYAIVDQLTLWTYGYSQTFPVDNRLKFTPKTLFRLINPPIIAVVLSVILIFLGVRVPDIINRAFSSVADAGMALPFIYIGGMLATMTDLKYLKSLDIYVGMLVKMLVFPISIFMLLTSFGIPLDMAMATTILFGLPSMPIVPMLAGTNNSDEKYATATVLITTVASLLTLTFVTFFMTVVFV